MARLHLFEFMDQPWLPSRMRGWITDQLRMAEEVFKPYDALVPLVAGALARSGQRDMVDLCSGSGGPALRMAEQLRARGQLDSLTLTDLYPNPGAALVEGARYWPEAVDATAVPPSLSGLRTVFNAFHHLPPPLARAVLADAARTGQPILVVETLSPTLQGFATALGVAALAPPFSLVQRPVRLDRVLLSTALPLLPLVLAWEGVVSCLRCYGEAELTELTEDLGGPGWRWEMGRRRLGGVLAEVSWLLGAPS
ncbi:MAG: hypothetical protein H6741_21190 [Alphaproteobacteria bacterium]|nr:hypothetical protein [Alphaproteobacteria bacterium]